VKAIALDIRIAIVTSRDATLASVRRLLESTGTVASVMLAPGGAEVARAIAARERPDVLIVEAVGEGPGQLADLQALAAAAPGIAVMLLSADQSPEFLRAAMRLGMREVLPLPLTGEALVDAIAGVRRNAQAGAARSRGRLIAFMGCKGGVGVTFLAANVAYAAAAAHGRRVVLIDLHRMSGDACFYLTERSPESTLADVSRGIERLDAAFLASSTVQVLPNLHVLAAPDEPEHAFHIEPAHVEALLALASAHYDLVVADCGASFDDICLPALDRSDVVVPVLQPDLPCLRHARRTVAALDALGYHNDKLKPAMNRAEKRQAAVSIRDVEQALKRAVSWSVPNDHGVASASVNQGVPVCALAPRATLAQALRVLSAELLDERVEQRGGWLKSLLGR
jgi:pilus assembly protein CpaE